MINGIGVINLLMSKDLQAEEKADKEGCTQTSRFLTAQAINEYWEKSALTSDYPDPSIWLTEMSSLLGIQR